MSPRRRRKAEHTEEWADLLPLFWWPEQEEYEEIRPLVLFGDSVAERAVETGSSERTLYRRIADFGEEGMPSLFGSESAKRQYLPLSIRRMILDLKAEYPPFSANEISGICYARSGRKPDRHTVQRVLSEEALQLKANRRFAPYHETSDLKESRTNVVTLHYEGWADKAIAGYLEVDRSTVYRVIRRWVEEGPAGLEDKPRGRPKGVQKVDLRAILAVKEIQQNPELGAFRVQAELEQADIHLGVRTVGRILRMNRETYGLGKPKRSPHQKKRMLFEATRRHQIWTADVRYLKTRLTEQVYGISILDNYSRCVMASAVSTSQDTNSFLSVFYRAVERYGAPEMLVTDGGGIFHADRALSIYEFLGIEKEEIERGKPYQSYIETTFKIQKRMIDYYMAKAETWQEVVEAHERWLTKYNTQRHWAHTDRKDGRRSPSEALGFVTGTRYHPEDLQRAFFETRFTRILDVLGYARFRHWRLYAEEGLAKCEVALWVSDDALSVEFSGEPLACYDVSFTLGAGKPARLGEVKSPRLFVTRHRSPQLRLFELDEQWWLKALQTAGYSPRNPSRSQAIQEPLFPHWLGLPG